MRVSKELGLLLKEKEYDRDCQFYRWDSRHKPTEPINSGILHLTTSIVNHNDLPTRVSAPTYWEVLEWLRDKFLIHIYCRYECSANEVIDFYYTVDFMINAYTTPNIRVESIDMDQNKTLEFAITEALNKLN